MGIIGNNSTWVPHIGLAPTTVTQTGGFGVTPVFLFFGRQI